MLLLTGMLRRGGLGQVCRYNSGTPTSCAQLCLAMLTYAESMI